MRRVFSAIFGGLAIAGVIAAVVFFVITSSNQPAKISFVSNGGTAVEYIQVEPGNDITAPEDPVREGYTFTGWYIDRALTSKYNFSKMPDESVTLFAGWEITRYKIEFFLPMRDENEMFIYDGNNELVLNSTPSRETLVTYGEGYDVANAPNWVKQYEGYEGEWKYYNADTGEEITDLSVIKCDIEVKPSFKIKQFNLYFCVGSLENEETKNNIAFTIPVDYNGKIVKPEGEPDKIGHTFRWWTYINGAKDEVMLDDSKIENTVVKEDMYFGSSFSVNTYYITFYSVDGRELMTESVVYGNLTPDNTNKNEQDLQKIGHEFAGWKVSGQGDVIDLSSMLFAQDVDLYPHFVKTLYNVTFFYNDPNTSEKMIYNPETEKYEPQSPTFTYSQKYEYESQALFPALPELENFKGVSWINYEGSSGVEILTDTAVEIKFERTAFLITFDGNEANTFSEEGKVAKISVNENLVDVWSSIVPTAPTKHNSVFFGWNTNTDGTGKTFNKDFVLEEDLTVYADWYSSTPADWAYSVANVGSKRVAIITGYKGSQQKATLPDVIRSSGSETYEVYQLGDGTGYIDKIWNIKYLLIPYSVQVIAERAFYNINIQTIKFAENSMLTTIGAQAFSSNGGLQYTQQGSVAQIELPASVSDIAPTAFSNCVNLSSIYVDSSNQYYSTKDGVLYDKMKTTLFVIPQKTNIKRITVPSSVELIKNTASSFSVSGSATTLSAPTVTEILFEDNSKLKTIENNAFKNNVNLSIFAEVTEGEERYTNLPNLETVGDYAFSGTKIKTFNIKKQTTDRLEKIGAYAFQYCRYLSSFSIPSSVSEIGEGAFYECESIKSAIYPNDVTEVAKSVFYGCTDLTDLQFTFTSKLTAIRENAFNGSGVTAPNFNNLTRLGVIEDYAFAKSGITVADFSSLDYLTTIKSNAFSNCVKLATVNIGSALSHLAVDALANTSALSKITVDSQNVYFTASKGVLYDKGMTRLINFPSNLTDEDDPTSFVKSFNVPSSVEIINQSAFSLAKKISSVTLSSNVKTIEANAFNGCEILKEVLGFTNVETLGEGVFNGCTLLSTIGGENSTETDVVNLGGKITIIPAKTFLNCVGVKVVKGVQNVTSIYNEAFSGCTNLIQMGSALGEFMLPNGLVSIGMNAFVNTKSIIKLQIFDQLKTIGDGAFSSSGLDVVNVAYGSKLETIGDFAFENCTDLESFNISGACSLLNIGSSVNGSSFKGCTRLSSFDLSGCANIKYIAKSSFENTAFTSFTVPETVTSIGTNVFAQCSKLTTLTFNGAIPSGLTPGILGVGSNKTVVDLIVVPSQYLTQYQALFGTENGSVEAA